MDDPLIGKPAQVMAELEAFVVLVKEQNVSSYWKLDDVRRLVVACRARDAKRVVAVSVDMPKIPVPREPYLCNVWRIMRAEGYDAHCILGDSANKDVIKAAKKRAPYDLCLINGNHNDSYVRADSAI